MNGNLKVLVLFSILAAIERHRAVLFKLLLCGALGGAMSFGNAAVLKAHPSNAASEVLRLKPGDRLALQPGTYAPLTIKGLHGTPSAWIVITGPESGSPAVVTASQCCNAIEIVNSSFVSIENLTIDSKGIDGSFGISAKDGRSNLVHDIKIQNNRFIGQGGSQQTDAISTKTPTWGWIIRGNEIRGAGTGMYLGNSDGTMPFIAGVIENNLIENTVGYNIEIKWQRPRPSIAGMPDGRSSTIVRNNVFVKDDRPSPDGDRPNVLFGGFPETGAGASDLYEVYGNLFVNNPREALLQASGRVSIHDNIFVGGEYTAIALYAQDLPLKLAHVYNNTIYTERQGILFGSAATQEDLVVGNLIFAAVPISGPFKHAIGNMGDTLAHAAEYVTAPSFNAATMDFYPLPGKCEGRPLDLKPFAAETDYALDFNRAPKNSAEQGALFRGAYAGAGTNPGWKLDLAKKGGGNQKSTANPESPKGAVEITRSTARRGESGSFLIVLHSPGGRSIASMQWELLAGGGIMIYASDVVAGSAAASADKTLACSGVSIADRSGQRCLLAGGRKRIPDGPIAIVRYRVGPQAKAGPSPVRIDKVLAVGADIKAVDLGHAEGVVTIE